MVKTQTRREQTAAEQFTAKSKLKIT